MNALEFIHLQGHGFPIGVELNDEPLPALKWRSTLRDGDRVAWLHQHDRVTAVYHIAGDQPAPSPVVSRDHALPDYPDDQPIYR